LRSRTSPPGPAIETPPELLAAIEAEIEPAPLAKQVRALSDLFQLFTRERSRLRVASYLDVPRLRSAYLRYHVPLNAARAAWVLRHLLRIHPRMAELPEVVDLGAGPGSASLAALFELPPSVPRRWALHDRSRAALRIARALLEDAARRLGPARGAGLGGVTTSVSALPGLPAMPRRALVLISMVLNEARIGARGGPDGAAFLGALARRLDPGSAVVIIEPALREPGRSLLAVHDAAAASGDWRVLAPCTHQRSCPLLRARDRSWCHFRIAWRVPRPVMDVAAPLGLARDPPSLSFLALERTDRPPGAGDPCRARVIGDRMRVEGGKEGIYLCREGLRELVVDPPAGPGRGDIVRGRGAGVEVEVPWGGE
jgi:ribosomal protein RSM22 (predicted rRNA methylase)